MSVSFAIIRGLTADLTKEFANVIVLAEEATVERFEPILPSRAGDGGEPSDSRYIQPHARNTARTG
jgi:hypothetical protein